MTADPTEVYHQLEEAILQQCYPEGCLHPLFTVPAGSRVLDVGCGAGQMLRTLSRGLANPETVEWVGVDCDPIALRLGERLGPPAHSLVQARGECLPFPSAHFSRVVCRVTLAYMNHCQAVQEMVRVMQPGGLLWLQVENWRYYLAQIWLHRRDWPTVRNGLRELWTGFCWGAREGLLDSALPAWVPAGRLRRLLQNQGCSILAWEPTPGGQADYILVRKDPPRSGNRPSRMA